VFEIGETDPFLQITLFIIPLSLRSGAVNLVLRPLAVRPTRNLPGISNTTRFHRRVALLAQKLAKQIRLQSLLHAALIPVEHASGSVVIPRVMQNALAGGVKVSAFALLVNVLKTGSVSQKLAKQNYHR
jgi:hypothetical protein